MNATVGFYIPNVASIVVAPVVSHAGIVSTALTLVNDLMVHN